MGAGLRWGQTEGGLDLGLEQGSGSARAWLGPGIGRAAWGTLVPVGCAKHW